MKKAIYRSWPKEVICKEIRLKKRFVNDDYIEYAVYYKDSYVIKAILDVYQRKQGLLFYVNGSGLDELTDKAIVDGAEFRYFYNMQEIADYIQHMLVGGEE